MNAPKLPLFLLSAALLVCAVVAWRQRAELTDLRATAVAGDERARWQRQVADLEQRNREQQAQLAAARAAAGKSAADEAGARRAGADGAEAAGRTAGRGGPPNQNAALVQQQAAAVKALLAKPDVQALLEVQKRATFEQRYTDLFRKLNLPPDQIAKVTALLEERANTMQDLLAVARDQGINLRENPTAYKQLVTDTQNQLNTGIKAVIGEDGFTQLSAYDRTIPQRNLVNDFGQRLSRSDTPLTPTQTEQLVQIFAANPPQRTAAPAAVAASGARVDAGAVVKIAIATVPGVSQLLGITDDSGRTAVPNFPITQAAVNQAQSVLSGPQLAALQSLMQQQQAQQQLKAMVTETLVKTQPPVPAPVVPPKGG